MPPPDCPKVQFVKSRNPLTVAFEFLWFTDHDFQFDSHSLLAVSTFYLVRNMFLSQGSCQENTLDIFEPHGFIKCPILRMRGLQVRWQLIRISLCISQFS